MPPGSRSSARFCSKKCKQAAHRRRIDPGVGTISRHEEGIKKAVETKQSTLIERSCAECGQELNRTVAQINSLYCSAACKQKAYRKRQRQADEQTAAEQTPLLYVVRDPDKQRASGINNRLMLDKQIGDYVKLIYTGDEFDGKLGDVRSTPKGEAPAPEWHVWVEFRREHGIVNRLCHHGDLEIMVWAAGPGARGLQELLERMTVAYRKRYGFDWIYAGGKVTGGIDGYFIKVGETTFDLDHYYAARAHWRDYFNVGVSPQAQRQAEHQPA